MPMPKRTSVEDFFAQLGDHQRPHLERLRALSLAADPRLEEKLAWNLPAYAVDGDRMWLLQNFKTHCSLRFSPSFFTAHRDAVEQAGFAAGAGFVKLPYDRPLPEALLQELMAARIAEHEATSAGA